jgi:hypothetical protein
MSRAVGYAIIKLIWFKYTMFKRGAVGMENKSGSLEVPLKNKISI